MVQPRVSLTSFAMVNTGKSGEEYLVPVVIDERKFGGNYLQVAVAFENDRDEAAFKTAFLPGNNALINSFGNRYLVTNPTFILSTKNWNYDPSSTSGHSDLARVVSLGGDLVFENAVFTSEPYADGKASSTFKIPYKMLTASVPKDSVYVCKRGMKVRISSSLSNLPDELGNENATEALRLAESKNSWALDRNIGINCLPDDTVILTRDVKIHDLLVIVEICVPAACIYFMNTSGLWGSIAPESNGRHVELGPVMYSTPVEKISPQKGQFLP